MTTEAIAPAIPLTHPQINIHRCLTIRCAECGDQAWDGYQVHFTTENNLWAWIFQDGWTQRPDGRVLCRQHSAEDDCAHQGHDWQDWAPSQPGRTTSYRYCDHCGHSDTRPIDLHRPAGAQR